MKSWLFLHHRAASTWTSRIVSEYAQRRLGYAGGAALNSFRREPTDAEVTAVLAHPWCLGVNPWASLPSQIDRLSSTDWRSVRVVREPRDVLVSAYYSCRDYHPTTDWPELHTFKSWLQRIDEEAGIIATMGWVSFVLEAHAGWARLPRRPSMLSISYEELFSPELHERRVRTLLQWLFSPVDVDEALVRDLVDKHRFEALTGGRSRGDEDTTHHYRKGVAGDWKRHWTPRIEQVWRQAYP